MNECDSLCVYSVKMTLHCCPVMKVSIVFKRCAKLVSEKEELLELFSKST